MKLNDKIDWWNNEENQLDYAKYQIKNTEVFVGNRPDSWGTNQDFYHSIACWLNVTDRFVRHKEGVTNVWIPWNEAGKPTLETIFASLKYLHYWIDEIKVKKIYIHCD